MGLNIPRFTQDDYKIVEKQIPYEGMFRVVKYSLKHRLFEGGWSDIFQREIFERPSAVAILPYDPELDRVILIQQFRAGALSDPKNPWLIEIIAGMLGPHEDPKEAVLREAQEEVGDIVISAIYPLYSYFVSPGGSNEKVQVYIGKTDASHVSGVHGLNEENENINVLNLTTEEAFTLLHKGEIKTSPAILSLQWLEYNRQQLTKLWQNIK